MCIRDRITPAHDPNDFEVGLRHNLPIVRVFTYDGHMTGAADKAAADALVRHRDVHLPPGIDCNAHGHRPDVVRVGMDLSLIHILAASLDMRESFAPVKIWNNSLWMLFAEMVRRDIKWRWYIFRQRT